MDWTSTLFYVNKKFTYLLISCFCLCSTLVYSQTTNIYPNNITHNTHVDNPSNALTEPGFATLNSYGGVALGIGSYSGILQFEYNTALPAGTTSYVKIDFDEDLLSALLGGELGGSLADLLGTVALGNHYFTVTAKNGNDTVLYGSSTNGLSTDELRLITNVAGDYLLAITPDTAYDKIEIEDHTSSLLLGTTNSMDVYYAYYIEGQNDCSNSFATSYTGTGGTVDALGLGAAGVENPEYAIDNDPTTSSEMSLGLLTIGGTISQTIYFETPSEPTDQFHITLMLNDASIINLGLADGISVEAFLGNEIVYSQSDFSLLSLDLLNLMDEEPVTLSFTPDVSFDRIRITLSSSVQLNLTKTVNIYEVYRSVSAPTLTTDVVHICSGETAELTAQTGSENELRWYEDEVGGTPITVTAYDEPFTTPALTTSTDYYVAAAKIGCIYESSREKITVEVHDQPDAPSVVASSVVVNYDGTATLEVENPEDYINYNWYDEDGNFVETTPSLVVYNVTEPTSYFVEAAIGDTCTSTSQTEVSITITNDLLPPDVSPTHVTITEGETATFTATTSNPDVDILWYDEDGNLVFTGEVFETPDDLSLGDHTYTVVTQDPDTLQQSDPVTVTVTVVPPNTLEDCTLANSQTNGTTFLCLLCGVNNPNNAVDGDINTYSRFVAPASVTGSVWQELIFQEAGMAGDTITITLGTGSSLLDVDLLSGLSFESYNGNTANGDGGVVDNSIIELELLPGNTKGEVSFIAEADFDRVRIEYQPLLGVLDSGWRIYQAAIHYPVPTAITDDVEVCRGETATLEATPAPNTSLRWYDEEINGTLLANGNTYTTGVQDTAGEVTYYLAIVRNGCEDPKRIPVTVTVNQSPTAADITLTDNGPFCNEDTVSITPTVPSSSVLVTGDGDFTWYLDADKTMPISNGDIDGAVSYTIDANDVLTVTGLENSGNPYTYYASVIGENGCENPAGDLAEITITIDANATNSDILIADVITQCLGAPVVLSPTSMIANPTFRWYKDVNLTEEIMDGDSEGSVNFEISTSGMLTVTGLVNGADETYYVTVEGEDYCENDLGKPVNVQVTNDIQSPTFDETDKDSCGDNGEVSFEITNSGGGMIYTVYDAQTGGNEVTSDVSITNTTITFSNINSDATYWVGAESTGGCVAADRTKLTITVLPEASETDVTVNDQEICFGESITLQASAPSIINPVYRWYEDQSLSTELHEGNTYQVSPSTTTTYYVTVAGDATCENPPGAAAMATVVVNNLPATPQTTQTITITEGLGTILVAEIPGPTQTNVEIVWYDDSMTEIATGETYTTGALSAGTYTYYAGTRNTATGCLSESMTAVTVTTLPPNTVEDCTVANAQRYNSTFISPYGIQNPNHAVDGNNTTYSNLFGPTSVEGTIWQDLVFQQAGSAGDTITVTIGTENIALMTSLTTGLTFNSYYGDIPNADGGIVDNNTVELNLLSDNTKGEVSFIAGADYDRVRILYHPMDGALNDGWRIYQAKISYPAPTSYTEDLEVCVGETATFEATPGIGTTIEWYDSETDGTLLSSGNSYTTPVQNTPGEYTYFINIVRNGCGDSVRIPVSLSVHTTPTSADIDVTGNEDPLCAASEVSLTPSLNPASTLSGDSSFTWYLDADKTMPISNGDVDGDITYTITNNDVLSVTGLSATNSPYTYYVSIISEAGCENVAGDLKEVSVIISDPGTPTTHDNSQEFCASENPTIADLMTNESGVIWYNDFTDGTQLDPDTDLTDNTSYYGALVDPATGCESAVRLEIGVTINDPETPTTANVSQVFCASDTPTVSDIMVNENGVVWYSTSSGGTPLDADTNLTDEAYYYGVLVDPLTGCESSVRLAVQTFIENPGTPTGDTIQEFCASENPTVSDLMANEIGVIWYGNPTDGVQLNPSLPLTNATFYYASFSNGNGCESTTRLEVQAIINDPNAPTTDNSTQTFCASDMPTVADLVTNESSVVWYNSPIGGSQLDPSAPLADNTPYYAAYVQNGCESSSRLEVQVTINDVPTPTTDETLQEFCENDMPTIADLSVNESGVLWCADPTGGSPLSPSTPLSNNTVYYGLLVDPSTGCESSVRLEVTVQFYQDAEATLAGPTDDVCFSQEQTYTTEAGMTGYVWMVLGGEIIDGGTSTDNTITVRWNEVGEDSVSVSYTDTNGCSAQTSTSLDVQVITCSDITIDKVVNNQDPIVGEQVVFTITVTNGGENAFENVIVNEQLPSGYTYVSNTASIGIYDPLTGVWTIPFLDVSETATLEITVEVMFSGDYMNTAYIDQSTPIDYNIDNNKASANVDPSCLTVYNEFTPNNDGANDYFKIDCIEHYTNNKLEVYNRYGTLVYESTGYKNNWNGTSNKGTTIGANELPSGTYYYVLTIKDENTVKKGWVYLMRNN